MRFKPYETATINDRCDLIAYYKHRVMVLAVGPFSHGDRIGGFFERIGSHAAERGDYVVLTPGGNV